MIKNSIELEMAFSSVVEEAINFVMANILTMYKDIIQGVVYDVYEPVEYERTYQFLNSWKTMVEKNSNASLGTLYQDFMSMQANLPMYQHGNPIDKDLRPLIADMIYQGYGYYFDTYGGNFVWSSSRDAWTPLIDTLDSGALSQWFVEGMKQQGFQIRHLGRGRPSKKW